MKVENPKPGFELFSWLLHIPLRMPTKAQIEITNRCNLTCELCPREKFNLPVEDMSIAEFQYILKSLKSVDVIFPVGWGESFLHKDFGEIIDLIKAENKQIKLPTNGLLLDKNDLVNTALKIDYLTFSVDEMHNECTSKRVKSQDIFSIIELLVFEKKRLNSQKPFITVQSVLNNKNNDIQDIIRKSKLSGVDRYNILRPNIYDNNGTLKWVDRKKIYQKAELLGKKLNLRVDMFEYAMFSGIKRFFWKNFKGVFRVNAWCPRLSDFIYITIDGKVTPCCYLPRYIVGDLKIQSLDEIWNGTNMNEFRKNHKQICKNCQILKIK